jgi:hypothetical protein
MGQYLKGRKIGTCECMYYMRLSEAQELAEQGRKDDDGISFASYIDDNQTKFRFPFPDEDNGIPNNCQYNKSFKIPAGDIEVGHQDICVSNSIDGGDNVNIFIPCLYSKEFKQMGIKTSYGGIGEQFLDVTMEAIRTDENGKKVKKTIFECSRCHQMQRFSDEDVKKIKARATEYFKAVIPYDTTGKNPAYQGLFDYAMEVIKRIA